MSGYEVEELVFPAVIALVGSLIHIIFEVGGQSLTKTFSSGL
jgi:hypothetical protein